MAMTVNHSLLSLNTFFTWVPGQYTLLPGFTHTSLSTSLFCWFHSSPGFLNTGEFWAQFLNLPIQTQVNSPSLMVQLPTCDDSQMRISNLNSPPNTKIQLFTPNIQIQMSQAWLVLASWSFPHIFLISVTGNSILPTIQAKNLGITWIPPFPNMYSNLSANPSGCSFKIHIEPNHAPSPWPLLAPLVALQLACLLQVLPITCIFNTAATVTLLTCKSDYVTPLPLSLLWFLISVRAEPDTLQWPTWSLSR